MKLIKIYCIVITLIFFFINTKAQTYINCAEVISSGGGVSTGSNYSNFGVIGETFVNKSVTGNNYNTNIGFLYLSDIYTGIFKNYYNSNIKIFPNPTNKILNIEKRNFLVKRIEIYSIWGNKVFECEYCNTINISEFPDGIYLLKIIDNNGNVILSEKIIKN